MAPVTLDATLFLSRVVCRFDKRKQEPIEKPVEPFEPRDRALYLSTLPVRFVLSTKPDRATKRKRGRRAFSSFFALHPAHPPSIRFSFITTAAVYVFATARSTEATSSFTLEMKALHRRTGGRKRAWEWFFIGTSYKAILHSPLLCTEAVTDFLFLPWSSRAQDVPPSFSLSFPSSSATFRLCGNLSTSLHATLFPPFSSSMNVSRSCFYMVLPCSPKHRANYFLSGFSDLLAPLVLHAVLLLTPFPTLNPLSPSLFSSVVRKLPTGIRIHIDHY